METMKAIDFTQLNMDTIGTAETLREFDERYGVDNKPEPQRTSPEEKKKNMELLERAMKDWTSLAEFRKRRRRARKYARGDQWFEPVPDPEDKSKTITEETLIKRRGKFPLKQNVIRPVIKNILGQFRLNKTRPMIMSRRREDAKIAEMLTNTLLAAEKLNNTRELDARNLEEFLLSGMAVSKQGVRLWKDRNMEDLFQENINPNRIFFNSDVTDIRGMDIIRIGEIIDAPMDDVEAAFAKDEEDGKRIRSLYKEMDSNYLATTYGLSANDVDSIDFLTTKDPSKARVIEVWELRSAWRLYCHDYLEGEYYMTDEPIEAIQAENEQRLLMAAEQGIPESKVPLIDARPKLDQYWYVKYLTPNGDTLDEMESPFEHGEHPYTLLLYPLVDGEVWGLVEDIIDQQRHINRIIGMLDWIIGNSAKGVLMAPWDSVPDEEDPEEWSEKWTKADSVMFYKAKAGVQPPQQVSANSVNVGAKELLSIQMTLMKEISGVHGAIKGQEAKSGTPASLYAQEAQNAAINSMDLMEVYAWYRERRDIKAVKLITQYYEDRHIAISGQDYAQEANFYTADKARNLQYDLVITQSMDAPVFRAQMDDMLYRLLEMGGIDLELFLKNTSMPFADKMLESIRAKQQAAAEGQMPPGVDPAQLQGEITQAAEKAQAEADPRVAEMLAR